MTTEKPKFNYGGQAVIEGVMMRGAHLASVAVRDPEGNIVIHEELLNTAIYQGKISKIPFLRGLIGLWDALVLGTRALIWSAEIAIEEELQNEPEPKSDEEKSGWMSKIPFIGKLLTLNTFAKISTLPIMVSNAAFEEQTRDEESSVFSDIAVVGMVIVSLSMGVGLFIALPAALSSWIEGAANIENRATVDTIEGIIKLAIFVGYIFMIGQMEDVKRLFGYHGAEHKTINAYEAGDELTPENVQKHSIEHPRCGTAFLLTVIALSVVVHWLTGRPDNIILLVLSRVLVILPIAGLAYEIIRFTAKNANNPIVKAIVIPNLLMQRLTTRQPDTGMLEVAIASLNRVLAAEEVVASGENLEPKAHLVLKPITVTEGGD